MYESPHSMITLNERAFTNKNKKFKKLTMYLEQPKEILRKL